MKKLLWMGLLCGCLTAQAQDPNFHIYLAFGQSNMEGTRVLRLRTAWTSVTAFSPCRPSTAPSTDG